MNVKKRLLPRKDVFAFSPEKVQLKTLYEFTINPGDERQFFNQSLNHRIAQCKQAIEALSTFDAKTYGRMEISSKGRWHFHGWIWFISKTDIREFYSKIHEFGRKCKYFMNELRPKYWWTYVHKQKALWDPYDLEINAGNAHCSRLFQDYIRFLQEVQDIDSEADQ